MRSSKPYYMQLLFRLVLALILLVSVSVEPANAQARELSGRVVQANDMVVISNVHVINLTAERGTTTGNDGSFLIEIHPNDTLYFQAIGFASDSVIISPEVYNGNKPLTVQLHSQVYEISGVDITPLPSYDEFKRKFINFQDTAPDLSLALQGLPNLPPRDNPPISSNILNPVSYFYDRYSKRGKELIKMREVVEREKQGYRAGWTFDHDMIRRITGIEDEEEIFDFLAYCNFSNDYILSMKEFEIYEELISCYEKYIGNKMEGSDDTIN